MNECPLRCSFSASGAQHLKIISFFRMHPFENRRTASSCHNKDPHLRFLAKDSFLRTFENKLPKTIELCDLFLSLLPQHSFLSSITTIVLIMLVFSPHRHRYQSQFHCHCRSASSGLLRLQCHPCSRSLSSLARLFIFLHCTSTFHCFHCSGHQRLFCRRHQSFASASLW
jgi:hypothetical protein